MLPTRHANLSRITRAVMLVMAMLIASGCAGGTDAPNVATLKGVDGGGTAGAGSSGSARSEELSTEQALIKLSRCLRKQGLDVPDPKVDSQGNLQLLFGQDQRFDPSSAKAQAAFKVCRPLLDGIIQSFSPADITEIRDTMVKYAACVRKNGFDLPDPNFFNRDGPFGKVDLKDPRYKRADVICRPVLQRIQEVLQ